MNELIITDESNRVFPLSQIYNNTIVDTPEKKLLPLIDHSNEDKSMMVQEFDGRLMWDNYLATLYFQKTSSWNTAVTNVLSSRLSILSAGEISPNADYSYILYCPKTDITISPLKYTTEDIFSRSNYYGAIYMYTYGTSFVPCFLFDELLKIHPQSDKKTSNLTEYVDYTKSCKQLLGNDFEKCGDQTLSRIFRASLVGKLANDIYTIKWDLIKFGPVLSSIDIYEDFLQFNGLTPYNGNTSKKLVGNRSVVIVGWKKIDNQEYWIVDPCIGYTWGIGGYFLLNINAGLNIENEAIAIYPDFEGFTDYINQKFSKQISQLKQTIPEIYYIRQQYPIDNKYFVHKSYLTDEIKKDIESKGTYINKTFLPDYKTFFSKNIADFLAYKDTSKQGISIVWFMIITGLILILLFFFYKKLVKS
jgi:hypothetical protein